MMATATTTKAASKPRKRQFHAADHEACIQADRYILACRTLKASEQDKANSKAALIEWLGTESVKLLPDGRTVTKVMTDSPAAVIERKAYTSTTITVAPPPPAV
jgi:hypothetical protein